MRCCGCCVEKQMCSSGARAMPGEFADTDRTSPPRPSAKDLGGFTGFWNWRRIRVESDTRSVFFRIEAEERQNGSGLGRMESRTRSEARGSWRKLNLNSRTRMKIERSVKLVRTSSPGAALGQQSFGRISRDGSETVCSPACSEYVFALPDQFAGKSARERDARVDAASRSREFDIDRAGRDAAPKPGHVSTRRDEARWKRMRSRALRDGFPRRCAADRSSGARSTRGSRSAWARAVRPTS